MTRAVVRVHAALGLMLAATACGGAQPRSVVGPHTVAPTEDPRLNEARTAARAHPDDPAVRVRLAEAELLLDGGSPAAGRAALDEARAALPRDVRLAYLAGTIALHDGQPQRAFDAYLSALEGVVETTDPMASVIVELATAGIDASWGDVPSARERAEPIYARVYATGARLTIQARRALWGRLRRFALEAGDAPRYATLASEFGCPTSARIAGPFGVFASRSYEQTLPAEGRGPMADAYDLGPGRGRTQTRTRTADQCVLGLSSPTRATSGGGARVVESTLHVDHAAAYDLLLQTGGITAMRVSVDGAQVVAIDRRVREVDTWTRLRLELAAGDHELELKVLSGATPTVAWNLAPAGPEPLDLEQTPSGPLDAMLRVRGLLAAGRVVAAREALVRISGSDALVTPGATVPWIRVAMEVADGDPFAADSQREDRRRELITLQNAREPGSYRAQLDAVRLLQTREESLRALGEVVRANPQVPGLALGYRDLLVDAGLEAEADGLLRDLRERYPSLCGVLAAHVDSLFALRRFEAASAHVAEVLACNAQDTIAWELALARRDYDAAAIDLDRRGPFLELEARRRLERTLAAARGEAATVERLDRELESELLETPRAMLRADRAYRDGDRAQARRILETEVERSLDEARGMQSALFALSGRDRMEAYRVDGREAVRRFEASGHQYEGSAAVLVFDYMVTRLEPSGSATSLVHQIYRIQSQQGIEQFATVPVHGRPLTVRVLRADGSIGEPDSATGAVDLPPLHVGDYVETEYVTEQSARWGDAFLSDGWTFQNFEEPFDHSEMVFVVPQDLPIVVDARGPVPPPTETRNGDLRIIRYVMTEMRPLEREPNMFPEPPIQPSLRAGVRIDWDRLFGGVEELMSGGDAEDPAAVRLVLGEIGALPTLPERERLARIARWVGENIEPAGAVFGSAANMVSTRHGNLLRVFRYLLTAAGFRTQFGLARSVLGERPRELPSLGVYDDLVLRIDLADGPLWVVNIARGFAFDTIPPQHVGQEVVLLDGHQTRARVDRRGPAEVPLESRFDVEVDPRGVATVRGILTFRGANAGGLRNNLEQVPPAERSRLLAERLVPGIVPGGIADPRDVSIAGLDDWNAPVSLRFVARTDALFAMSERSIRMLPLGASDLEENTAALATRRTSQVVQESNMSVEINVRGPFRFGLPRSGRVTGPGGATAELVVEPLPDGVRLRRRLALPLSIVEVGDYPALVSFAHAWTQLQLQAVTIER